MKNLVIRVGGYSDGKFVESLNEKLADGWIVKDYIVFNSDKNGCRDFIDYILEKED